MSGQMADVIVIDDEEFAVVEPEPGQLFEPRDLGLELLARDERVQDERRERQQ